MKWQALCATRSRVHRKTFREKAFPAFCRCIPAETRSVGSQFITLRARKALVAVSSQNLGAGWGGAAQGKLSSIGVNLCPTVS